MENEGTINGEGFGQRERLTVRLRGLIRSYPRSIGIVKEFLQNADDAGASRLTVIWDRRDHRGQRLPDPRMARLQGPALLFANDQRFTAADFEAIRSIGESSKSTLGPKTGRFGLGFNTAYNVSDYPSFVSSRWAIAFDPHRDAVADDNEPTGKRWELRDLWAEARDWLDPFVAGGLEAGELDHAGTIFRLPLRTAEQAAESEICDEPFDDDDFQQIVRDLIDVGDEPLLFARNVLEIEVRSIDHDGTVTDLVTITTLNRDEVAELRAIGNAAVEGETSANILTWRSDLEALTHVTYRHRIAITSASGRDLRCWQISAGIFVDPYDRILRLNEQMLALGEKAIPWVGAAIRLELADDGTLRVAPRQRGKVFCTFPLPDLSVRLPCHINGCFDLDASRRQLSTDPDLYAEADRVRVAWNAALLEHAVPQAAALAVAPLGPDAAARSLSPFYELWPDLSRAHEGGPWDAFGAALLRRLAHQPLIRTRAGQAIAWESLTTCRLPPPLWGELLQEALRDDGLRLPDPDLPGRLVKSAERAQVTTTRYHPQELRDWLRSDDPPVTAVPLEEAPRRALRERSHVVDLLQFCLSDRKDDIAGLPLALGADGILRAFGEPPIFLADGPTRHLFAAHPEWFVDVGIQSNTRLRPCPPVLEAMDLPATLVALRSILAIDDGDLLSMSSDGATLPHPEWLSEVLRFLGERTETLATDALNGLALLPLVPRPPLGELLLHRADTSRPLLLPADDVDPALLRALHTCGIVVTGASAPLGDALRNFNRRHPGLMRPLSGPNLAAELTRHVPELTGLAADDPARTQLLDYLATPSFLDAYGPAELATLRELPLLRTQGGRPCAASDPGLYLPSGFQPPPLTSADFDLVDPGPRDRWRPLLTVLGLPTMDPPRFIADLLLPSYPGLAAADQRALLCWLRDQVDRNQLQADAPELVERLRGTPLLRGRDHELYPATALYDPGDHELALDRLARIPDFDFYADDRGRWRALFTWLGLRETPHAGSLLAHVDALCDRAKAGELELAEADLRGLLRSLRALWPLLCDRDPADAAALREALAQRAWLPPLRVATVTGFTPPEPRLYRGEALVLPHQLEWVASQRPALDLGELEETELSPEFLGLLGLPPSPPAAALADHLAELRDRWAKPNHGGLEAATLDRLTAAIYGALGRLEEPPAASDLTRLTSGPAVWDPERGRFWRVEHAFAAPIADLFDDRRGYVPGDGEIRRGLDRLGRRPHVEPEDIIALLGELREELGDSQLDEVDLAFVARLLRRLIDLLGDDPEIPLGAVPVPTIRRTLVPAHEVLVADAPWLAERLRSAPIALLHPRITAEVIAALTLRRLSQAAHERVAEPPALSGSPDKQAFCRQLTATIHDPEFAAGLRRLLLLSVPQPEAQPPDLKLLSDLRIEATDRLVTYLEIDGFNATSGEPPSSRELGTEEVAIFADDQAKIVYVSGDHWDTVVVQISEAINRLLGDRLGNLSHLEALLRTSPPAIRELLDHRRVPRLTIEESHGARESAAIAGQGERATTRGAPSPSLATAAPEAAPAASPADLGAPPAALGEPPGGRAIGLERLAFVGTREPAAGDRNPVSLAAIAAVLAAEARANRKAIDMPPGTPGYDVQSGRISDPNARFIRVYGLDGPWERLPVLLSSRDASAARTFGRQYWLYVVENARDPDRLEIQRIHDPFPRIIRYALDHRWRDQAEREGATAAPQVGWLHTPPAGEPARILAIEQVGMFTWLRVRLASGGEERRFYKPAIDRVDPN